MYIIYTGGTTGYPKGVMWRHEDIWRTLGGGIDFITGAPLADEWAQTQKGHETGEFVKLCAAPLIHGNAQVAALAGLFAGETIVLLPGFDAHEAWRAIERHQVNVLVIIGDAMARPLVEAYQAGATTRPPLSRSPLARRCSPRPSRMPVPRRYPMSSSPRRSAPPRPGLPGSPS